MIPDYKLCHGAVLAELVDCLESPLLIDELKEDGRLSSYVLNGNIGLRIKHSTQRLPPWSFTFTNANMLELIELRDRCEDVFVVFAGAHLGMACLTIEEMLQIGDPGDSGQLWIRLDRSRGKQFSVFGAKGKLMNKKPSGLAALLTRLEAHPMVTSTLPSTASQMSEPSRFSSVWRAIFQ